MISSERGLPDSFDPASGKNIKWSVPLGSETHSTPVVAHGRIYIGTNNSEPRDPKHHGDRGVLMCLNERDGALIWQLVVPKREDDPYYDWPNSGISSPATIEGDRVYIVDNRGEALCLDARGMRDGNAGPYLQEGAHMALRGEPPMPLGSNDADIVWLFDLVAGAGIWSHDAAHSSILIHGPHLYLNSGTGVDNTHKKIRTPDAPSLVVLDKNTGRLLARDQERIAPNIFHSTWSAPSFGMVNGKPLVFFGGGNGILYAFETIPTNTTPSAPAALKKVWQFDFDPSGPKENVHRYNSNRREGPSNFYGMPVFYKNRVYIAGGGDLFWGKTQAWLKCIDAAKTGDITTTGELWSCPLVRHTVSTPAIVDGLLFIADCGRTVHCLDPETGRVFWSHETQGEIWASPLVADGKVYLGTRRGDFWIFSAAKEKQILCTTKFDHPISATATAANGVVYIATMDRLYAIANSKQ